MTATKLTSIRGTRDTAPARKGAVRRNEGASESAAPASIAAGAPNLGRGLNGPQDGAQAVLGAFPSGPPTFPTVMAAYLYTVPDVMLLLRLSKTQVHDEIRRGRLGSVTVGRARRVPAQCLTAFVNLLINEAQERAA